MLLQRRTVRHGLTVSLNLEGSVRGVLPAHHVLHQGGVLPDSVENNLFAYPAEVAPLVFIGEDDPSIYRLAPTQEDALIQGEGVLRQLGRGIYLECLAGHSTLGIHIVWLVDHGVLLRYEIVLDVGWPCYLVLGSIGVRPTVHQEFALYVAFLRLGLYLHCGVGR